MLKNLKSYAIIAAFALGITLAYNHGYDKANTKWEQEVHNEYVKKAEATADKQAAINEVSQQYQEDLAALEGSTDRVINDLRNDGKRLRVKLSATSRELQANGGCLVDGRAELDKEFSRRLIGVTQRGDAWIKALQNTIKEMQHKEKHNG
ncbi:lysis protein [Yersinia pestis]|uniref:Endopeptidase Rz n=3 Tax=Berlinvirus TaxID=2732677 RepID=A0ZXG8_9CAUD|nr:lysis system i-spanin subunit Rz [Yersinia pestis]YP_009014862.1 Rz-like spanin [Yersinia phage Yep-phi]YP_919022.1 Rz-like spanin [Yersinia phage Berlin]QTI27949.1 Rz-like lysis protein [Yersinia phage vB_YpP-YepMm]ADQ83195.1 endopeptidase [Yersinia phage Yep-phi]MBD3443833.1 lysis protein [Yersinia pestis]MBD3447787.1 lysis protein [Yersinia pestis]MBD3451687.1 lysis protein [Yersinia pestis]